jgi:predicted DNA-binding transcriptional regulator YafY
MAKKQFSKFRSRWWAFCEIERQVRRNRVCTSSSLASDLEVDPRTVRRYIAFMREDLGAPIEYDAIEARYTLTDQTWTMPNVHLSDAELVALAVATRSVAATMPAPFTAPLEGLLAKLLDSLPELRRKELVSLQDRVDFVPSPVSSKGQQWVGLLVEAIRDERAVEMTYCALSKSIETHRRVDPYHLRFFAGAWYLIGYDHKTRHFPVFNLARVRKLAATDDTFRRKKFSAANYFRDVVGVTVGGQSRPVRILLAGLAAKTADERIWPNGFKYIPHGDGTGILSGRTSNVVELLAWIAAVGGDASLLPEASLAHHFPD